MTKKTQKTNLIYVSKTEYIETQITLDPSMRFVNITICFIFSCQTMNQKSATVFCLGPIIKF